MYRCVSVPTCNLKEEKKAFHAVLPEVINSVVTGPKLSELPEVGRWVKQLLEYTLNGGKLGRGLMVSVGYRMFEEPDDYSEETQHSARILGWCMEMFQAHFVILDDLLDGATNRRGKVCWHRQPKVGPTAAIDALIVYQSMMEVLEMNFGKTPIFTNMIKYFNETVHRATIGEHLDCCSDYNKEKNNIDVFTMEHVNTIAINKSSYYTFKLPLFLPLLLVKNGEKKANNELHNICMEFGRLMQCQLLDNTLCGGKLYRGLIASIGYRMLEEPKYFSEETQHSARVLGWCIEMLQTYFLILDDIMDGATTRRGKPCWHQHPNVGLSAINDGTLMYQCIMEVLKTYFGKTHTYTDLIGLFNETLCRRSMGEHLDCTSCYNKHKNNINIFTLEHYNAIATYKTAYFSFYMPIHAALLLVKNGKDKATEEFNDISLELGRLLQFQDDYIDIYGDESTTGKVGTDIQEGKCTWMAVTALQRCNDAQRSIFEESYGSKNPEHVKRVKQLYDELRLPQVYKQYEHSIYEDLVRRIRALPKEGESKFLLEILHLYYKRLF